MIAVGRPAVAASLTLAVALAWPAREAAADRATAAPDGAGARFAEYQVTGAGFDAGGEFCADFRLTAAQARWFFRRAHVLDAMAQHRDYAHLPCWVRGTSRGPGGIWRWEIRAGGTATRVAPDGTAYLLGCTTCDAVLGGAPARR